MLFGWGWQALNDAGVFAFLNKIIQFYHETRQKIKKKVSYKKIKANYKDIKTGKCESFANATGYHLEIYGALSLGNESYSKNDIL